MILGIECLISDHRKDDQELAAQLIFKTKKKLTSFLQYDHIGSPINFQSLI